MASRIKGITVEIDGDTTGLSRALKDVNSQIRSTSSQLKDVQRLLKLDPGNTELLTQKQRLLKDAISATKDKLAALKDAQAQAKEQLESGDLGQDKYDALNREIVATEEQLEKLEDQAEQSNAALEKMSAVGQSMEDAGDKISGVGSKVSVASAAVGGLGVAAVKAASDFDTSMSKLSTSAGISGDDLERLRDKAEDMGAKTKFSASEVADAFHSLSTAGWSTDQMLSGIEGVEKLATASGQDLADTADSTATSLKAFGLSAKDSSHYADVLAATASNTHVQISDLEGSMKAVAPVAGTLGYSLEDTASALGIMADAGIDSSKAGSSLRKIMTALSGDVKITGQNIGTVSIQTKNADGSMRSLTDILADCRQAFSGLTDSEKASAAQSLVGKGAMSAFLALMSASPQDVSKLTGALGNCDGAAKGMADTMEDNLAGQVELLKESVKELAVSFGEILTPVLKDVVGWLRGLVERLNSMSDGQKRVIVVIGAIVAAAGPLLVIIGKTVSAVGGAIKGFSALAQGAMGLISNLGGLSGALGGAGSALGAISGPVLAVIAVIAALAAAFKHLWDTNEGFRDAIGGIWNQIVSTVTGFCQGIVDRLNQLGFHFKDITDVISAAWNALCSLLAPVFQGAFSAIEAILKTVTGVLTGLLDILIGLFTGNWDQMCKGVQEVFGSAWDGICGIVNAAKDTIVGIANAILGWFGTSWDAAWSGISSFFSGIWNGMCSFVGNAQSTISNIANAISSGVSGAFRALHDTLSGIWNDLLGIAGNVWNGIKSAITRPIEDAKRAIANIVGSIEGFFSNMHIQLPHINLPHFSIQGQFSLSPPQVPHLSVEWYKSGGIMSRPTVFGMSGTTLLAGGEAGSEAILPLREFYDRLEGMLDARTGDTSVMEGYLARIAENSERGIYLDDGTLVGRIAPAMDARLGAARFKASRGMV